MTYTVSYQPRAARQLRKLPREAHGRVTKAVDALTDDPRPPDCEKISGADNAWRVRVGQYRIVYEVDDDARTVTIGAIGHRREVYRRGT